MKRKLPALAPVVICAGIIFTVCLIHWAGISYPRFDLFRRLEWITCDWRMRLAARTSPVIATNLGFVAITDDSIEALLNGSLPYRFGLHWPRQVHARLVDELTRQNAKAIAFDVLFGELRPDAPAQIDGKAIGSDVFFAREIERAGNVILGGTANVVPHELFRTNAWAVGDIAAETDADGILRRARPFTDAIVWHPMIKTAARHFGWDLARARIARDSIVFDSSEGEDFISLDASNRFSVSRLTAKMGGAVTDSAPRFEPAFSTLRMWQMGLLLAARELELDLSKAVIDRAGGQIILPGPRGARVIPLDENGMFYIDWAVTVSNPALTKEVIESLLDQYEARRDGRASDVTNRWAGKLVVVGSSATGNDLTDLGPTPMERLTLLASEHWNIANSVLANRFIRPLTLWQTLGLIIVLGVIAGVCTWNLRTLHSVLTVAVVTVTYIAVATWAFIAWRVLVPVVLPVGGSLIVSHVCLITWMVRTEQRERHRTREIFSKIVSPDIVRELLQRERLGLGGARRRITVFFADVRGFTDMSDSVQQEAEKHVASQKLTGAEAESYHDAQAGQVLETINLYLGVVAAQVKEHGGTLDKYIGDCVMAFWGAPVENPHHARDCVRAVIAAQRAIAALNSSRAAENERREAENLRRAADGLPPLPMLAILFLGSGINTGLMTVGLMGSAENVLNYTVFGREVNLASRLEGVSGRSRIFIGGGTYADLLQDDPALASVCRQLPPVAIKGFRDSVVCYEVPWAGAEPRSDSMGGNAGNSASNL